MPIRTALVSVSDKSGLVPFARALHRARRAASCRAAGRRRRSPPRASRSRRSRATPARPRSWTAASRRCIRACTAASSSRGERDQADLERLGAREIDLVVVNLYPFERVAADPTSLARAHRREHRHRRAVDGPLRGEEPRARHGRVRPGRLRPCPRGDRGSAATRRPRRAPSSPRRRSRTPPRTTPPSAGTSRRATRTDSARASRRYLTLPFERAYGLRYGENPHQAGAFYVERDARGRVRSRAPRASGPGARSFSFNNLVDVDAALDAVREFERARGGRRQAHQPVRRRRGGVARRRRTGRRARPIRSARSAVSSRSTGRSTRRPRRSSPRRSSSASSPRRSRLRRSRCCAPRRTCAFWRRGAGSAAEHVDADQQARRRRPRGAGPRRHGRRRGDARAGRDPARAHARGAPEPRVRLASLQAREVERDRARAADAVTVGVGAGQMSRVVSVQIACEKAGERARGSVARVRRFFPFPGRRRGGGPARASRPSPSRVAA